ncbi:MAG: hypothetical protein QF463_05625 [Vicinamibacterales bacterium]|jgi:hypothetical protein|nr:hypothetical protein [Acidobacteriota bacterium]MDP6373277.1 hypothetical protein [Vicinamibacterales bacterium]MDP6608527.1 hypothetical protein [Vicinamibacterales bacterium]HAK56394.1 hypothetical protein [Acidobacteriota bacterium]|tara:strand:- start:8031 stop:8516 length:486 start_codon:yes stop_codon:yes gene_type:complete
MVETIRRTVCAGVVIIAGAAGDAAVGLERLARRVALWPAIDPREHPAIGDDDPTVQSYAAEGAGTPIAARPLWPFIGSSSSVSGLERAWHISREDDALEGFRYRMSRMGIDADAQHAAGEFGSYVRAVQDALDLVDAWVTNGVPAPDDRTVDDGEGIDVEE